MDKRIIATLVLIIVAIRGTIFFKKIKNSTAAIAYGIYAFFVILIFELFVWKVL